MSEPMIGRRLALSLIFPRRKRKALMIGGGLAAAAIGLWFALMPGGDAFSQVERARRIAAFPQSVTLPIVTEADREAALGTMWLTPDAETHLRADLEAGRARLAWLSVWDDQVVDGDWVHVASGGFSLNVELLGTRKQIAIPVTKGGTDLVITGLDDGGGGITLGMQTDTGIIQTPVMDPGESLTLHLP